MGKSVLTFSAALLAAFVSSIGQCHADQLIAYAGGGTPRGFYSVDQATGSASFLFSTPTSPNNLTSGGLAALSDSVYATNLFTGSQFQYAEVDLAAQTVTGVAAQDGANWQSLAANQELGTLYTVELADNVLREVTPGGSINLIGTGLGITEIRGMAFDDVTDTLYAVNRQTTDATLFTIDLQTGLAASVGTFNLNTSLEDVALAFDEVDRVLYAVSPVTRSLYTVNTSTGEATFVGAHSNVPIGSLTWLGETPAVPEPSTIHGMLGLLLVGVTLARRRRSVQGQCVVTI